ncbi:NADH-quinone oxidoreductase subunit N [Sphingobacterium sp. SRCM116780]|uniref:NADH-quinone oxidoreductase subunit N n=1 Tax=Sphingobacterium sp. SRCM116780 TaxID=2907623 RepID=UPI001F2087B0|nr:NADH-quinone oxidoreductase subunit N [Sphingobacterium sp. SRCM116780]UIR55877.1 NADH-quinone oxidoreductase subunit N [Sphingobacterium sp. SRCM116780]
MGAIITLSILALLVLYLGLFKANKSLLPVSLIGLLVVIGFLISNWTSESVPLYNGMILFDHYAIAFSVLCVFVTVLVFALSKSYFTSSSDHISEYYTLLLFSLVGAILVNSYHNLALLFLGIEIMSVALYILVGIRKNDPSSNEASIKYFIMGAFSTGFLLFGITLLYGASGTFDLQGIKDYVVNNPNQISPLFYGGILLMIIGLTFKVGAAPFHFWTPDVYDGAPILITSFMSTVVKVASFAGLLRLFTFSLLPLQDFWTPIFLGIAVITLFIGNLSALMQSSFKRMLAYSSISHAGYMLFAIIAVGANSANAIFLYGCAYSLATLTAFAGLILVKRAVGSDHFESFNGLAQKNPYLAAVITIAMLSLAGIPLTAGFIGKFMMFSSVMDHYHIVLLIIAVLNAAVAVYYYLKVVVAMYFRTGEGKLVSINLNYALLFIVTTVLTILIGIYPNCLMELI